MEIQQPIHGQEADAVDRMRKMFVGPPGPLRATGTDDSAIENSEFARSARRSSWVGGRPYRRGSRGRDPGLGRATREREDGRDGDGQGLRG